MSALPVPANPRLRDLPTPALRWWAVFFDVVAATGADLEHDVVPAARTYIAAAQELLNRRPARITDPLTPRQVDTGADDRLFDAYPDGRF